MGDVGVGVQEILRAVSSPGDRVLLNPPVYLSLDIDCLDPAYAPGTGTPVVGGFSTHDALRLVRGLAGLRIVALASEVIEELGDRG